MKNMKSQIYDQARYYEIAFSFVDQKKQADLFEKFIKKYSKVEVESVLDVACGTALQLEEMAKRGYESIGLDANIKMLDYLKKKLSNHGLNVEVVKADMNKFKLNKKVDFAYMMMGSIIYTKNSSLFLSHLDSIANSLKSGSLYLIENFPINWATVDFFKPQIWSMREDGIKVKATYKITSKNALTQVVTQTLKLEVDDHGKKMEFIDADDLKIIFPEEIKLLVEKNDKFEFIGFFERDAVKMLKKESSDNIVILRKK
jgi:SAM-dependent methyltransferase